MVFEEQNHKELVFPLLLDILVFNIREVLYEFNDLHFLHNNSWEFNSLLHVSEFSFSMPILVYKLPELLVSRWLDGFSKRNHHPCN